MKNLFLFLTGIILVLSCNQPAGKNEQAAVSEVKTEVKDTATDGVFIHITESYNDPHRVLMPLKMALLMSEDKDVLVYLDIHAVEMVAKGAADIQFADFETAHTCIKKLLENGTGIYACPTCLKVAGISPDQLMEGIKVAQKEKFFDFTKGRIITLDY